RVPRMPRAGEIVHTTDDWEEAAGGGPVTAVQLLRLGADVEFHTVLGDDELGQRAADQFREQGLRTRIQWRAGPTRRAFTHTDGAAGGTADGRRYEPAPVPGPVVDAYGCGDSFSAALAFALARGDALDDALALAARAGAAVLAGRGAFAGQIDG